MLPYLCWRRFLPRTILFRRSLPTRSVRMFALLAVFVGFHKRWRFFVATFQSFDLLAQLLDDDCQLGVFCLQSIDFYSQRGEYLTVFDLPTLAQLCFFTASLNCYLRTHLELS